MMRCPAGGVAAAATRAAAVEMLKVPLRSPPVPQVSTRTACSAEVSGTGSGGGAHRVDKAGEFVGGFAAGGDGAEEGGEFEISELTGEEVLHQISRLLTGEFGAFFDDALEVRLCGHGT